MIKLSRGFGFEGGRPQVLTAYLRCGECYYPISLAELTCELPFWDSLARREEDMTLAGGKASGHVQPYKTTWAEIEAKDGQYLCSLCAGTGHPKRVDLPCPDCGQNYTVHDLLVRHSDEWCRRFIATEGLNKFQIKTDNNKPRKTRTLKCGCGYHSIWPEQVVIKEIVS